MHSFSHNSFKLSLDQTESKDLSSSPIFNNKVGEILALMNKISFYYV